MLGILVAQLRYVAEQVKEVEVKLLAWHRADETSRRLQSVPGLGPITASAIVATVIVENKRQRSSPTGAELDTARRHVQR
jgi:transposase